MTTVQERTPVRTPAQPSIDLKAIKQRQQATWASGDFSVVGITLQIVGESLAEAADVRAGERVLDVAAGNGNATLAAARRFAAVTSTDYVPALLERGRDRARGRRAEDRLPGRRRRGPAVRRRQLRCRALDLRRHVRAGPPSHSKRDAARGPPRRPHRPGELDPRWLHRPVVQGDRRSRAATRRAALARALGHGAAPRRTLRPAGRRHSLRAEELQLPLSLACALAAGLPRLLRPDAQGLRRARRQKARSGSPPTSRRCSNG